MLVFQSAPACLGFFSVCSDKSFQTACLGGAPFSYCWAVSVLAYSWFSLGRAEPSFEAGPSSRLTVVVNRRGEKTNTVLSRFRIKHLRVLYISPWSYALFVYLGSAWVVNGAGSCNRTRPSCFFIMGVLSRILE